MVEIVNLRRARKSKARAEKETTAADNRVQFGVPKRDRNLGEALGEKASREIDKHKLDDTGDES
jgi:hypothetical protein